MAADIPKAFLLYYTHMSTVVKSEHVKFIIYTHILLGNLNASNDVSITMLIFKVHLQSSSSTAQYLWLSSSKLWSTGSVMAYKLL